MTVPAIDPALATLLAQLEADDSAVRPSGTDFAGARRAHESDARRFTPEACRDPAAAYDTAIAGPAGALPARIYRPHVAPTAALPTITWFHGGGWTTGSLETGDIFARALCRRTPAVVVSVDYRLSPEHQWPAATDDAAAALRWVADHVDDLGGAPDRVAVGGDSAGGNIAAVAAQAARDAGPALATQILIYPVLDLDIDRDDRYPSLAQNATGYYVTREDLRWSVANYLPAAGTDPSDPGISPILAPNVAGVAPVVLAIAEYDPLRDQGTAYAERLRGASVPTVLHEGRGLIHGCFDMIGISPGARAELDVVIESIRELLARPEAAYQRPSSRASIPHS